MKLIPFRLGLGPKCCICLVPSLNQHIQVEDMNIFRNTVSLGDSPKGRQRQN